MPNTIPMGEAERDQRAQPHLFVIDGEPEFLHLMRDLLQDERCNVTTTNYVPDTFAQIVAAHPDVLILDLVLGQRAGWDLLEALPADAATAGIPVIVVSTQPGHLERARAEAVRYPAFATLDKPFDLGEFLALVAAALNRD